MSDDLTTTSYAILSLLGVQPWTGYQLAQQMDRSVGRIWPRAASVVYEEPKRLVRLGLADATVRHTGKRASTEYSITEQGRKALARWLEEPGGPPTLEYEALLKIAFADNGSLEALRTNLRTVAHHVDEEMREVLLRMTEYAETGGPFPDRLPVIALAMRFYVELNEALHRWVTWAEGATSGWTGVTPDDGAEVPPGSFDRTAIDVWLTED